MAALANGWKSGGAAVPENEWEYGAGPGNGAAPENGAVPENGGPSEYKGAAVAGLERRGVSARPATDVVVVVVIQALRCGTNEVVLRHLYPTLSHELGSE